MEAEFVGSGDYFYYYQSVCEGNGSEGNTTSDLWLVEDRTSGLVTAAFLLLFLVIGLPWNLLVIVTIVKQRLYTQPTIILLLNLVVTDIILIVFVMPFSILTGFKGSYFFGNTDTVRCLSCKIGFVSHGFSIMSAFIISLMSCDRFFFIYKPLKYEFYITGRRVLLVVALTWIFVTAVSILPLFGFGHVIFYPPLTSCVFDMSVNHSYYPVVVFFVTFIPIPALVLSNVCVCRIVQKNITAIYGASKSSVTTDEIYERMKKKRQQKQLHLIEVFGCLLGSNIITWLLIVILCFLLLSVGNLAIPPALTTIAHISFMSQVVVHPLVETVIIKDVRKPLTRYIFGCCLRTRVNGMNEEEEHTCECFGKDLGFCRCCNICGAALLLHYPENNFTRTLSRSFSRVASFISKQNTSATSVGTQQSQESHAV